MSSSSAIRSILPLETFDHSGLADRTVIGTLNMHDPRHISSSQ